MAANGIPQVALNAYRVAAARMANVQPGCGIPWYLLAGIGREESDHGRFGGAVLHSDGVSTPKIIGPALDGKVWDFIPAPGNGLALDGDARYAHALGPMQFIPSTWAGYGADANGDGRADIFNINDAALGAARYLCAAGGDLSTTAGRTRAVLTYNHNDQYLAQVLALAEAYRTGVPISGLPVGITKGALPKVGDTGYIPPANPGSPTAVGKTKKSTGTTTAAPTRGGGSTSAAPTGGASRSSGTPATGAPSRVSRPAAGSRAALSPVRAEARAPPAARARARARARRRARGRYHPARPRPATCSRRCSAARPTRPDASLRPLPHALAATPPARPALRPSRAPRAASVMRSRGRSTAISGQSGGRARPS